jgi:hypothetical protein
MTFSDRAVLHECSAAGMIRSTTKARRVVLHACQVGRDCGDEEIRPEHLLVGLLAVDKSFVDRLGLPPVDAVVGGFNLTKSEMASNAPLALAVEAKLVISSAADARLQLGHVHTGTEHLLLGLVRRGGAVSDFLKRKGISEERVLQSLYRASRAVLWAKPEYSRA